MVFVEVKDKVQDLVRLSDKIKTLFIKAVIVSFLFEVVKIFPPYIFKEIIDNLVVYDPAVGITVQLLMYLVLGYFASLFVMTIFEYIAWKVMIVRIVESEADVVRKAFHKLLHLDLNYHENNNTGYLINKVLKGGQRLVDLLFNVNERFFPIMFQAVLTLFLLLWVSWPVGLSFAIFAPVFVALLMRDSKLTQTVREKFHHYHDVFAGKITQSISNIRTVKDFGNEQKELKKSDHYMNEYVQAMEERNRIGLRSLLLEDSVVNVARLITLALSVYLMLDMRMTAGTLVFVITLSEKAYINLSRLSRVYYRIQDAEPSIQRFKRIMSTESKVNDNPGSHHRISRGSVVFDSVTFRYENSRKGALNDVSFEIPSRSVVAFVGRSGSGKTTLVKMLLRHFDPNRGDVFIDGRSVKDYSFRNLKEGISVVSQDVELFNESILDNIAYGVKKANRADVVRAAKMAHAHDFIMEFQKGYDTLVGERGIRLSGGQKQRIAIARAILKKPKIIVFDEATSSLDSESEKFIHESMFGLVGKVTLIIIAHRFSTIEHADKVILLENGRIVEHGTQKELIKSKGMFAKLRRLQKLGDVV
ncbi:ABC transporter ATP-binding protein [Candidatus Woesearchaeota archaeon]|nr:ABC transporter ATP-binding protein [Candidatus Woesearchaeota archaeon]